MPVEKAPELLPVVHLFNIDPRWDRRDRESAMDANTRITDALREAGHPVTEAVLSSEDIQPLLSSFSPEEVVIFNGCEEIPGIPHSEPEAVRAIEAMGFTYTGSASEVLSVSEDKIRTKEILSAQGIPTPQWRVYDRPRAADWDIFPAIVKTTNEHCSTGISPESVAMNKKELEARIAHVIGHYEQPAMVEDFIDGREFHVPLWGNGTIHMLPVVEMDFSAFQDVHDRLCTYDSKFEPESLHYRSIESLLPAPLSSEGLHNLEKVCLDCYRTFGCRDYARLDVRLRDGRFYVLDVNPNADLSYDASIACAAEQAGYTYPAMMNYLIRLAANRHPRLRD